VPTITKYLRIKRQSVKIDTSIYTVKYAAAHILKRLAGWTDACLRILRGSILGKYNYTQDDPELKF
jgi:hypothetical protein